jgi:hypothetical protein
MFKDFQKWIGYTDVKSAPVHFYVQRSNLFDTESTPIPFDLERVNVGNAMDLTTGIFTAPRPGIYFFSFTGLAHFPASNFKVNLGVSLILNGDRIGSGWVEEANTVAAQLLPLTIQSTLNLEKDDQVWMEIIQMSSGSYLFDNFNAHTHFTGFMLQEDIVASLN